MESHERGQQRLRRRRVRFASAALLLLGACAARAEITTDRSASILVWPKIIADGTRDTIVELTNTSNAMARAHCFYVNAGLTDPDQDEGPLNPRLWLETDFDIVLTRQQPTYWDVSEGRTVDPTDPACDRHFSGCRYAGFDPGRIPPVVPDFVGELKCVQVDDSGAPLSGNSLIGEATIQPVLLRPPVQAGDVLFTDFSTYNAIGIVGDENNGDGTLVLGGGQCAGSALICTGDEDCGDAGPCALEYGACPARWILNHAADGAPDPLLQEVQEGDEPSGVDTELTIVPCTQNFETQQPTSATIQFLTWNEFESQFSTSTSITCWGNFRLQDIGAPGLSFNRQSLLDAAGTLYMQTRMRAADATPVGMLMVGEEFYSSKPSRFTDDHAVPVIYVGVAAANLYVEGERDVPDIITIPAEQVAP